MFRLPRRLDCYLQQSSGPHAALCAMAFFTLPLSVAIAPEQRLHSCVLPTTRALGAPLPAGLRSLGTQIGVVLQPSHFTVAEPSSLGAGFVAAGFLNCGSHMYAGGPANAAAVKRPLKIMPTEL